jgi:hypothetical protein
MKPPAKQAGVAAYHAELARAFAARRCACGAPVQVTVVVPGEVALIECGIVLKGAKPDRNLCLRCAGLEATYPPPAVDCGGA